MESQITQQQDSWQRLNLDLAQMQFQADFYQQQLQPLQDTLDSINHQISEMRQMMPASTQEDSNRALENIERVIDELTIN